MRLYLSSQNLGNHADRLLEMVDTKSVAYIGNSKDHWSDADRATKVAEHKAQFEALGFVFTEIDLREYFEKNITEDDLATYGLVWGTGGNTFLLRRALNDSGMDKALTKLIRENKLVYGGSSAGSIVATPSLSGTELGDKPSLVKTVYGKDEIIWNGLGLIDYYFVPHYESDWFGAEAQAMVEYFEAHNMPYKALRDGEVLIIDGEIEEVLS